MDHILEILQDREIPSPYGVVLSESMHEKLRSIIDSEVDPRRKLNILTGTVRQMVKNGEDTGLESDTPKKGSSRAVFFPKEPKHITLDGKQVQTPSVVKIAFPGKMDKYNKSGKLLGEHQNRVESDRVTNSAFSVIHQHPGSGEWHSNPNGVLPPHFGHHPEHHWLEMGRVEPITEESFKEATKTATIPDGLSQSSFERAIQDHWSVAHGGDMPLSPRARERMNHPFVKNVMKLVSHSDIHPGDFREDNLGLWTHPLTGKKHIVVSDFGFSNEVAHHYNEAREGYEQSHGKHSL